MNLLYRNIVIFAKDFRCGFGLDRVYWSVSWVGQSWAREWDSLLGYLLDSLSLSGAHSRVYSSRGRVLERTLGSGLRATVDSRWILLIFLCWYRVSQRIDGWYLLRYLGYFVLRFLRLYSRHSYLIGLMSRDVWVEIFSLRYSASQKETLAKTPQ